VTNQPTPPPGSKRTWQVDAVIDGDSLTVTITAARNPGRKTADDTDLTIPDRELLTALAAIARTLGSLALEAASEPAKAATAPTHTRQASHPWSPADDHLLISRDEAGMTTQELAILLKRSSGAIRSRLHLLNFKPGKVEEP